MLFKPYKTTRFKNTQAKTQAKQNAGKKNTRAKRTHFYIYIRMYTDSPGLSIRRNKEPTAQCKTKREWNSRRRRRRSLVKRTQTGNTTAAAAAIVPMRLQQRSCVTFNFVSIRVYISCVIFPQILFWCIRLPVKDVEIQATTEASWKPTETTLYNVEVRTNI